MAKSDTVKNALIQALEKSLGVVTTACRAVDISRETYYKYLREDKEFAKRVRDIENITLDFAESQLHKQVKDGNTTATIFLLKCKGKQRGYIERVEVDQPTSDQPFRSERTPINFGDPEDEK